MQRSTCRRSHQPRPPHLTVAAYPTSTIHFNQATTSSSINTASFRRPPPINPRLAQKRKIREALMAESFSAPSGTTVYCSPSQLLDALLIPSTPSSLSSKLASVHLVPDEPVPKAQPTPSSPPLLVIMQVRRCVGAGSVRAPCVGHSAATYWAWTLARSWWWGAHAAWPLARSWR